MKAEILKIAGVKSEKEFYKKYPTEEAFQKAHGKEFKKAQMGAKMQDKGQLKKLDQLTDFGGVPKAQNGVDSYNIKAATTEFGKDRKCGVTSANAKAYKADLKESKKIDKEIEKASIIEQKEIAAQKAQEWANYTNPELDAYGTKYGRKDKTFSENYNKFIAANPKFAQEQSTSGLSPEQRYAMINKMAGRSGSADFAAPQRLRSYMQLPEGSRFTDQQLYEATQKMGGIDKYADWWKGGYPEIKQRKGGSIPKAQVGGQGCQTGFTYVEGLGCIPDVGQDGTYGTNPNAGVPSNVPLQSEPRAQYAGAQTAQAQSQAKNLGMGVQAGKIGGGGNGFMNMIGGQQGAYNLIGNVVKGVQDISDLKKQKKKSKGMFELATVVGKAAGSNAGPTMNRWVRPENMPFEQDQLSPSYGVNTNYLQSRNGSMVRAQDGMNQIGGNPTEIQNTYAPNNLYQDLGYEPLDESSIVKQFLHGGYLHKAVDGYRASDSIGNFLQDVGKSRNPLEAGINFGMFAIKDNLKRSIANNTNATNASLGQTAMMQAGQNLQNQYSSFVREGGLIPYAEDGWMSHDWQPQVITQFGEHPMSHLLAPDPMMDTLRTGGHIRQNNRYPTDQYALGGELKTTWGGHTESISKNPFEASETGIFRGQSHDNGGIGVKYGEGAHDSYTDYAEYGSEKADADVEVEGGEPYKKDEEGNMRIAGNLMISKQAALDAGNKDFAKQKYKTAIKDMAFKDKRYTKNIDKATEKLTGHSDTTSRGILERQTLAKIIEGNLMKLKNNKIASDILFTHQDATNDTAKMYGLVADDLAKGKFKIDKNAQKEMAKWGAKMETAQDGKSFGYSEALGFNPYISPKANNDEKLTSLDAKIQGLLELLDKKGYDKKVTSGYRPGAKTKQGNPSRHGKGEAVDVQFPKLGSKAYEQIVNDADVVKYMIDNNLTAINEYDPSIRSKTGGSGPHVHFGYDKGTAVSDQFRKDVATKYPVPSDVTAPYSGPGPEEDATPTGRLAEVKDLPNVTITASRKKPTEATATSSADLPMFPSPALPTPVAGATPQSTTSTTAGKAGKDKFDLSLLANQLLPYFRPVSGEPLDPSQLYPEMAALATNQLEPVQAQQFSPLLQQPYDISLQDQLNEITAQQRASERLAQGNPAAIANIAAQSNALKNKVLGEQFRMNQALRAGVYSANRGELNQAYKTNLDIMDRQYGRQAEAKSITKQTALEALKSMTDKKLKNIANNRNLAVMENLYNFRYDPRGRAINYNPLAQFVIPQGTGSGTAVNNTTPTVAPAATNPSYSVPEYLNPLTPAYEAPATKPVGEWWKPMKNGGKAKKEDRNSSLVKAMKGL